MQNRIIFLACFLILALNGSAQNFNTIRYSYAMYYYGDEMYTIYTDSVKTSGSDSLIYFYRITDTASGLPGNCTHSTIKPLWPGTHMINGDSIDTHLNRYGDSIFIKKHAKTGESFRMYTYANGDYIIATMVYEPLISVLNTIDLTKFFRLQVFDSSGQGIPHTLNGRELRVTLNYGIINALKWYYFPDSLETINVLGSEYFNRGTTNPDARSTFEMLPGNEFHYRIKEKECDTINCVRTTILEKRFVLERTLSPDKDTLHLLFQRVRYTIIDYPFTGSDSIFEMDSLYQKIILSEYTYLDRFNRQSFPFGSEYGYSVINFPDSTHNSGDSSRFRSRRELFLGFDHDAQNQCLIPVNTNIAPKYIYGDGLGLTYFFEDTSSSGQGFHERELIYYKKGIEEWGEPVNFSKILSTDRPESPVSFSIYPNPAGEDLYLEVPEEILPVEFRIYDLTGRLMGEWEVSAHIQRISLRDIPGGVYLLRIGNKKESGSVRLIIL